MEEIDRIPQSFNTSILDSDLTSITKNSIEFSIDSLLEDGLVKDIPIVKTLVGIIKTTQNISNYLFLKKILAFLKGINDISPVKRMKIINEIDNSNKYRKKVGENLLFILDHCENDIKAEYIAYLFKAFLDKVVTYDEFLKGSFVINRLTTADFDRFIRQDQLFTDDSEFIGAGLIFLYIEPIKVNNEIIGDWDDPQIFSTTGGEIEPELTPIGTLLRKVFVK